MNEYETQIEEIQKSILTILGEVETLIIMDNKKEALNLLSQTKKELRGDLIDKQGILPFKLI